LVSLSRWPERCQEGLGRMDLASKLRNVVNSNFINNNHLGWFIQPIYDDFRDALLGLARYCRFSSMSSRKIQKEGSEPHSNRQRTTGIDPHARNGHVEKICLLWICRH
jgi:hypothetical protein